MTPIDRDLEQYVRDGGRVQQLCPVWICILSKASTRQALRELLEGIDENLA